jgi:hypothetical protein
MAKASGSPVLKWMVADAGATMEPRLAADGTHE